MQASCIALAQVNCAKAAQLASQSLQCSQSYSSRLLKAVKFVPESVSARSAMSLLFPWEATTDSLNGFKSVHGGALSTLADTFTRIHATSALPSKSTAHVRSVSLEISFCTPVFAEHKCICVTRVINATSQIIFTEFTFENADTHEMHARGTHILAVE